MRCVLISVLPAPLSGAWHVFNHITPMADGLHVWNVTRILYQVSNLTGV